MTKRIRIPTTYSPGERKFWAIHRELERKGISLEEEYELIQQKKSDLSKSQRDYVELMVQFKEEIQKKKEQESTAEKD